MVDEGGQAADFQSSWNNAAGLTEQINNSLEAATTAYMKGDLGTAFKHLTTVTMRFVQHLTEQEETILNKTEVETGSAINRWQIQIRDQGSVTVTLHNLAYAKYKEYNNCIMRLLNSKGLLLQGKRDSTQMKW